MVSFTTAFLSILPLTLVFATPAPVCNHDNLYRALVDPRYSSSALVFCSTYISIPATTVTATTSTVSSGTSTSFIAITPDAAITSYAPTVTVEATTTTITTIYTTYRAPDEGPDPNFTIQKRDATLPPYVSGYPTSRISSGCSCLSISTTTSTITPLTTVPATSITNTATAPKLTTTVTGSPTTVTTTTTVTSKRLLPTLCDPINFKNYRDFIDRRPFNYITVPGTTQQECCLTCYGVQNCLAFIFNPVIQQCSYYSGTKQTDFTYKVDICPLGVTSGSREEVPGWPSLPQNYGPCLDGAPLGNH